MNLEKRVLCVNGIGKCQLTLQLKPRPQWEREISFSNTEEKGGRKE
jgi:hypothetical protein